MVDIYRRHDGETTPMHACEVSDRQLLWQRKQYVLLRQQLHGILGGPLPGRGIVLGLVVLEYLSDLRY